MGLVEKSIALIKEFEPMALKMDSRGYCVCSSFGKDSVALVELYRQAGVKFFIQHNITGIDPPPLVYFSRREMARLEALGFEIFVRRPRITMFDMIVKKGMPPLRQKRYCCEELKERRTPETQDAFHSFGVRKAESSNRSNREAIEVVTAKKKDAKKFEIDFAEEKQLMLFNDNTDNRRLFENCTAKGVRAINPLIAWDDAYLWDFIKSSKASYCELYDQGHTRLGCVGCPMNVAAMSEIDTFGFKNYYLACFDKMLKARQAKGLKTNEKWKDAASVLAWWRQEKNHEELAGQMDIWEV